MSDRYDTLKPGQVAVTLRSMPRRFRAATALADPETVEAAVVDQVHDLVASVVADLAVLEDALRRTINHDRPEIRLHADVAPQPPLREALDTLESLTTAIADKIEETPASDWTRSATTPDGTSITAEEVAQTSARATADPLRNIERLLG